MDTTAAFEEVFASISLPINPLAVLLNFSEDPESAAATFGNQKSLFPDDGQTAIDETVGDALLTSPHYGCDNVNKPSQQPRLTTVNGQDCCIIDNINSQNNNRNEKIIATELETDKYAVTYSESIKFVNPIPSPQPRSLDIPSEFNPLLLMPQNTTTNENINCNSTGPAYSYQEELSLACSRFKGQVDAALKRVQSQNPLRARLTVNTPTSTSSPRWSLKISSPHSDLLRDAQTELLKSPQISRVLESALETDSGSGSGPGSDRDEQDSIATTKSIESLLFDEEEQETEAQAEEYINSNASSATAVSLKVPADLIGPLLGPKHHLTKRILIELDCQVKLLRSQEEILIISNDQNSLEKAKKLLEGRLLQLTGGRLSLSRSVIAIEASKMDWMRTASSAKREFEDILWNYGLGMKSCSFDVGKIQLTALSSALMKAALKSLAELLFKHQVFQMTFRCRNDLRDYTESCEGILEGLLRQSVDCVMNQRMSRNRDHDNWMVEVEISGSAPEVAKIILSLDRHGNNNDEDLKCVERRLRLYAPEEIREFICGKKDGKLNRIMKETGVSIALESTAPDSMAIDLSLTSPYSSYGFNQQQLNSQLLHALKLVEGELPSELAFHVPESHHKRMIGHGGKAIQRIMKKWGVYVKFMNSHESAQAFNLADPTIGAGTMEPALALALDNVIVRTPAKNSAALTAIKEEIFLECFSYTTGDSLAAMDQDTLLALKQDRSWIRSLTVGKTLNSQLMRDLEDLTKSTNVKLSLQTEAGKIVLEGAGCLEAKIEVLIDSIQEKLGKHELKSSVSYAAVANGSYASVSAAASCPQSTTAPTIHTSLSEESFQHFPSALFVRSSPNLSSEMAATTSLSPKWSLLLSELDSRYSSWEDSKESYDSNHDGVMDSVEMLSASLLNASPPLVVGQEREKAFKNHYFEESALSITKRRSADIF